MTFSLFYGTIPKNLEVTVMVYFTGDIHGFPLRVIHFAEKFQLTENDTIVILGDVGMNYFLNERDEEAKNHLNSIKPKVLCIHGNHEARPETIDTYHFEDWNGGKVWIEDKFPNLKFAKDGEIYEIEGLKYIAIGGAYSVDKHYRLARGYGWWQDEQPSDQIKAYVEKQIKDKSLDIVLSHTCPFRYEPTEVFLSGIDQSTVDTSTEKWLEKIESALDYKAWFCGHWHTNKRIDKIHFLFESWETIDNL